ncbi:MAG: ATP-binding protein [Anaerolineae bacterium]|nr:ATP-binding protein [Anaerolineae bacterium]
MDDSDEKKKSDTIQTVVFPGRFESLEEIGEFIARFAQEAGFDPNDAYAVQLAVDEACTNIIQYAYGGEDRGDIVCTCEVSDEGLEVELRDKGAPFDPDKVPSPNLDASLEERKVGGLGLYFMRRLMDNVCFDFTSDEGNVLTMVKRKEKEP